MTNQEIIDYFGSDRPVYQYTGSIQELQNLQETTYNSYNYIIVAEVIYFVANNAVVDPKAKLITGA